MSTREKRLKRVETIVFLAILLIAVGVSYPMVQKQQKAAALSEACGNMSSVSLAMLEFDQEFGRFPCKETRRAVMEITASELGPWTGSSNDCFRQLIAYGIQSEDIFFAVHPERTHQPDNEISPLATKALEPGEVGLSFLYGHHHCSNPELPLLVAPMISGTHLSHNDMNQAAVAHLDGSTVCYMINRQGEILLHDGTRLFDPTRPIWPSLPIDIRHPEFPD